MRRQWRIAAGLVGLGATLFAFGCWRRHEERPVNVVLILVDTLRADHLSAYGYPRATSPHLDAFAASSILFEKARSQASCTYPSVNSLLTSRRPSTFMRQGACRMGIPEGVAALPELLAQRGYRTIAVSASPIVRKSPSPHNDCGGFGRGFDVFDESCFRRDASCLNEAALAHLSANPAQPFFLYLHYMEPHDPYSPPASHARRFAGPYAGKSFIANGDPNPIAFSKYAMKRPGRYETPFDLAELDQADVAHLVDLYDEEIAYFDSQFEALRRQLEERGLLERTIVAVVSDVGSPGTELEFAL